MEAEHLDQLHGHSEQSSCGSLILSLFGRGHTATSAIAYAFERGNLYLTSAVNKAITRIDERVRNDTILWRIPEEQADSLNRCTFSLHYSKDAALQVTGDNAGGGIEGADVVVPLTASNDAVPQGILSKFPFLRGCTVLQVLGNPPCQVSELVRGQLAVCAQARDGSGAGGGLRGATGVQAQGVLDELFLYDGPLGAHPNGRGGHTLTVWAPTAARVVLLLWDRLRGGPARRIPMDRGPLGQWRRDSGSESWLGRCYNFECTVYHPLTQSMEVCTATDPYSRALTANGERTVIVDLDAAELQPARWQAHARPSVHSWTDISVYELHIRDFSACDERVPVAVRGKYGAFSCGGSLGLAHLRRLRGAGLTHIHLLPSYDFGSVPERVEDQLALQEDLTQYPPDSDRQQAAVLAIADADAYNWGYDPVHWGVPEGSYSMDPDGPRRTLEYREMVQALHELGFCVIQDVVYTHTYGSGPHDRFSVLDKIVPGYYHRREESGEYCDSICGNNTAAENLMLQRLIVDDIVHWVTQYKVDGFRFDVMGHLMRSTMAAVRDALNSLSLEKDGIDGSKVYIYGEGWDFGEVAHNQRGRNATQINMAGTMMGTFNDRMRDGAMGGSPFLPPHVQGFATGLHTDPNAAALQRPPQQQRQQLLRCQDWVRAALCGNLRNYHMESADGQVVAADQIMYYGNQPAAYGLHPCENIVYNGCHDNETIFDQVTEKAAAHVDVEGRRRMCLLSLSLVALAQGIPFFHAGDDLLRSKSLDRDSYNSGDWFNRLDWSMQTNNFGVGLPVATKNKDNWDLKRPLLGTPAFKPSSEVIAASSAYFLALLRIRYSSPLFRMSSAEHIQQQVKFYNTGPDQVPGVIVMELESATSPSKGAFDAHHRRIVVLFNATPAAAAHPFPADCEALALHPALAGLAARRGEPLALEVGVDRATRTLTVPPRSTGVFVEAR